MVEYNWDSMDEQACKEADAVKTMNGHALRMSAARVKRHELRNGLEQAERRRRFACLLNSN